MSDMIRSGHAGRCALGLVVLLSSLPFCLGQEQSATPPTTSSQEPAKQDAPAQGTKDDSPAKAATAAPQETPATTVPPSPAPATPSPTPAAGQPAAKGKASSKKGKTTPAAAGTGQVTSRGVQQKPYEIGPEDVLYLNVLHQPDVSSNLEVRPDGYVSVRFAGEIQAAGLTAQQLSDKVAEKLTVYFNHPEVNIQVLRINSKKYYISGEVRKPGAYPLAAPKTIYEALIEAGGPAEFAKSSKIYILRGTERIPFNYKDVSKGKNLKQNILLENGDVIQVP
jgi:polysaccharide export outer membrane protein